MVPPFAFALCRAESGLSVELAARRRTERVPSADVARRRVRNNISCLCAATKVRPRCNGSGAAYDCRARRDCVQRNPEISPALAMPAVVRVKEYCEGTPHRDRKEDHPPSTDDKAGNNKGSRD
jgi:hypothetical protein